MNLFGSGYMFARPTQDAAGNAIALGAPIILGINQEVDVDINFSLKELYGQSQFAEDLARGAVKLTGKIKNAQFFAGSFNTLLFGQPSNLTAGTLTAIVANSAAVATAATVTVTPPNTGTFAGDICVLNAVTGVPMVPVSASPSVGQYAVTVSGTYSFGTVDVSAGVQVIINYQYTASVSAAYTQSVANLEMGSTPFFSLSHTVRHNGKQLTLLFPRVTSQKFSMAMKNEDFTIPEMDWTAAKDPVSGKTITWSTSE